MTHERLRPPASDIQTGGVVHTQAVQEKKNPSQPNQPVKPAFDPTSDKHSERASAEDGFTFPLSFAQKRLWFLDQVMPGNGFYNLPHVLHLQGPISRTVLERSLNEIVRRHETLRTSFRVVDGEVIQFVVPEYSVALPLTDLRKLPDNERSRVAQRLADEIAWQPFDLSRGPLIRAYLLWLRERDYALLFTVHHIVADGWSMRLFREEFGTLCNAFARGQRSPLPDLSIQYGDFAAWQREWMQGEVLESQLAYWKRQLDGITPLQLPTDRPRPQIFSYRGATRIVRFSKPLTEALKMLSQRESVTLFMTLFSAFCVLLSRYTGQDDIVVGLPVAGRNRAEIERLIGFFVNTLVLRADLSGEPGFCELLKRVREMTLSAYAHQDLPFEVLVEKLHPERHLNLNPFFQVTFQLLNGQPPRERPAMRDSACFEIEKTTVIFDLAFNLYETSDGLEGGVEYSTDLFDNSTVSQIVDNFRALLEDIVANPDQKIWKLTLLSPDERKRQLVDWNTSELGEVANVTVPQLFEAQAYRSASGAAVVFQDQCLTYHDLNRRANQLAHFLKERGVRPEALVGICIERSFQMIVALLGVLKAGGAYVPLDPSYPRQRLEFMIHDSRPVILITQQSLLGLLPKNGTEVVCIDSDWAAINEYREENTSNDATSNNLAYVIYTSGSTGTPKGVLIEHRGLCSVLQAQLQMFGVRQESRVLQFASFSFDASASEIFMALLGGATLVIPDHDSLLPGSDLIRVLQEQAITTGTFPPSVLAVLDPENVPLLGTVIAAGEACSPETVARWAPGRKFFNAYGPTEASICATLAECTEGVANPPIGRPLPNTQIYILDRHLEPVPIGAIGELHIGGMGLARGYLNHPELTDKKFIHNPFVRRSDARLYKTGDLGRYRADGNIEFVGRIDRQVKIRGFRLELEEIEIVLAEHPGVHQCAVIACDDSRGDKHLLAYVVPTPDSVLSQDELRAFLSQRLPRYMLPSDVILRDTLPQTPSGKVDRQALSGPEDYRRALATRTATYLAPETQMERELVNIWQEVLHLEKVGTDHNFFDLGGHSLLMVEVHNKLKRTLTKDLSIIDLFRYPTIRLLAKYLEEPKTESSFLSEVSSQAQKDKQQVMKRRKQNFEVNSR